MTQELANLPALGREPVAALVIPARDEELVRLEYVHGQQLRALQKIVRGTVESLPLQLTGATLHFNEEGPERGLPHNDRASLLAWAHCPPAREKFRAAGDAVILGQREGGLNKSVPVRLTQLLVYSSRFRVQVRMTGSHDVWFNAGPVWASWHHAYRRAAAMTAETRTPSTVRVVVADGT